ncbi:hypothetical protein BCR44DRAFT_41139, partial [Catenaria anguillulae PL171]
MDPLYKKSFIRWAILRPLALVLSALSTTVFALVALASPRIAGTLMHLVSTCTNRQTRQKKRHTLYPVESKKFPVSSSVALVMPGPCHDSNVAASGVIDRGLQAEPDSVYSSIASVPSTAFSNPFHNRDRTASLTSIAGSELDEVLAISSPKPASVFPRGRKPAPLYIEGVTTSPSKSGHGGPLPTPVSASDTNLLSSSSAESTGPLSRTLRSSGRPSGSKNPVSPTRAGLPGLPESPLPSPYSTCPPSPAKPYNDSLMKRHSTTNNSPVKSSSSAIANHERRSSCPAVPIPITLPLSDAIQAVSSAHTPAALHVENAIRPPSPPRSIVDVAARLLPRFGATHSARTPVPPQPQAQLVQRISIIHPPSSFLSSSSRLPSAALQPASSPTVTSDSSPTQANGGLALAKMLSASRTMRAVTGLARGMQSTSSVGNQRRPPPQMTVHTSVVSPVDGRTLVVSSVNSAGQKTLTTPGLKSHQHSSRMDPDSASKV